MSLFAGCAMRLMFKVLGLLVHVVIIVVISCTGDLLNTTERKCDYFTEYKVQLENGSVTCGRCRKCDHSKGEGTIFECHNYTDTLCGPCKDGETYSLEYDEATVCDECKSCEEGQEVLENCTRFNDIKCGKCLPGYRYDEVTGDCIQVDTVQEKAKTSHDVYVYDEIDLMTVPMKSNETPSTSEFPNETLMQPYSKNSTSSVGIYIGISVTGALLLIGIVIMIAIWRKKSHKKNATTEERNSMISREDNDDNQPRSDTYDNVSFDASSTMDTTRNNQNPGTTSVDIERSIESTGLDNQ